MIWVRGMYESVLQLKEELYQNRQLSSSAFYVLKENVFLLRIWIMTSQQNLGHNLKSFEN